MPEPIRPLRILRLGRRPYPVVHRLQRRLIDEIAAGRTADTLLLLEHEPVITCGRGTDPANLGPPGGDLPVVSIERGGDVTWHGPGQLIGYPLLLLRSHERDLHRHLRRTEELLIRTCGDLGCPADRKAGHTGVWVPAGAPARKVASIGVAVRRWVTWHGFALNRAVNPEVYAAINPCGLEAGVMTSLDRECPRCPGEEEVIEALIGHLADAFGRRPRTEPVPSDYL